MRHFLAERQTNMVARSRPWYSRGARLLSYASSILFLATIIDMPLNPATTARSHFTGRIKPCIHARIDTLDLFREICSASAGGICRLIHKLLLPYCASFSATPDRPLHGISSRLSSHQYHCPALGLVHNVTTGVSQTASGSPFFGL